ATHTYAEGDQVVATWYNDSGSSITFTPRVSFDDPDQYNSGTSGTWYTMNQVTIPAYGTATTTYTIDSNTAGTHNLINVCRYTGNVGAALLDKIELEYAGMSGFMLLGMMSESSTAPDDGKAVATEPPAPAVWNPIPPSGRDG